MKVCSKCNQNLDDSRFSPSSGGRYLRPECKDCASKLAKERQHLKKKHGYPEDDYVCPICLKTSDELIGTGGRSTVWVVDHDHETKAFRGHLCHNCNRGLGIFKDDIETLFRAMIYLEKANLL